MNLYILRHAKAEERSARFPDSKRPLTASGKNEMIRVAEGMREMDMQLDLILSSPLVRAVETAQIVANVFESGELRLSKNLASGGDTRKLVDELKRDYLFAENILLVGHEPDLSKLVSLLTSGKTTLSLNFKKAGLCKLIVSNLRADQCATLECLLPPRLLRKFGKSPLI